ncbi:MAG: DUF4136 domain-containing protein [Acidobacteriota bacterium]
MRTLVWTVVAVALTTSVPVLAEDVTYDYAKGTDFAAYKTYSWTEGTKAANPLMDQRITGAINTQLTAKGLIPADADATPNLCVAYHAAVDTQLSMDTWNTGGWGGWRWGGGFGSAHTSINKILVGQIIVDIVDAAKKEIVWRGVVSGTIDPKASPEKLDKTVNNGMEKLFKNYPPKAK